MKDITAPDTEHYGHLFAAPCVAGSFCKGCGATWSNVISRMGTCPGTMLTGPETEHNGHVFRHPLSAQRPCVACGRVWNDVRERTEVCGARNQDALVGYVVRRVALDCLALPL